jgi:tRNA pseudouridine55 synthase
MPRQPQSPPIDGALLINKPRGKTSHDVVDAVRRILGFRQVGHLGTLDPLATGVLGLLLGRSTRLAQFYSGRRKRYECGFRFGFATDTYDADGTPLGPDAAPQVTRDELESLAAQFIGRIQQTPPSYSAKKIRGRPAHELARENKPVEMKAVEVEVFEFRLRDVEGPLANFVIECGAGTYIRSLAQEMGRLQGSGAHLAEITRTAVGEFTLDQTVTLEELQDAAHRGRLSDLVVPLERLLPELPRVTVLPVVENRVRHGAQFKVQISQIQLGRVTLAPGAPAQLDSGEWKPARVRVFNQSEQLIAIAQAVVPRVYQPVVVLDAAP